MPSWLLAWAARWGLSGCGTKIKLLHIEVGRLYTPGYKCDSRGKRVNFWINYMPR